MTDEFDRLIAGSLQQRASTAPGEVRGFTDVRRRVRRRRQLRVAAAVVPALAGVGYLATRSPADEPIGSSAEGASSTYPGGATTTFPGSTMPGVGWPTTSVFMDQGQYACFAAGEIKEEGGYVFYSDCQWVPTGIDPSSATSTTSTFDQSQTTTTMMLVLDDALFLNASTVDGAATWYANQVGAPAGPSAVTSPDSFVMAVTSSDLSRAESVAAIFGIPVRDFDAAYLDVGGSATDVLGGARVVVIIGTDLAAQMPLNYPESTIPSSTQP